MGWGHQAEEARARVGDAELHGAEHELLDREVGCAEAGHEEGVGGRSLRHKWAKVGKSGQKWAKVGKSGQKWAKVGKSGP